MDTFCHSRIFFKKKFIIVPFNQLFIEKDQK